MKNIPGKEKKGRNKAVRQEHAEAAGGMGEPFRGDRESKRQPGQKGRCRCV